MTASRRATRSLLALAALAAGCGGSLPGSCEDGSCGAQVSWRKTFQWTVNRKVDVLVVVDDTSAISAHAEALATGMAETARRLLDSVPPISWHVGFVRAGTCDASTRAAACGIAAPEQFLRSEWCNTITNYNHSGGLVDSFTCLADLGAADCGPAQPLTAAVQWLASPPRAGWEGFLRPDAVLMIVVVAGADDASGPPGSPTPVPAIAGTLKGLKPNPGQILVAMIGPGDCAAGEAPGPRLIEFANQFGSNGRYLGLCSGDLSLAFDRVFEVTNESLRPPCFTNVRDTDLETPGLQAECTTLLNSLTPDGSIQQAQLESCDQTQPPCWRLIPDSLCAGYVVTVEQSPDWCVEAGMNATFECLGCADANDPACAPAR